MAETEDDRAGVLAAIRAESEARLQRDYEAWPRCWVQSPKARRMESWVSLGVRMDEGWEAIAGRIRAIMERFPEKRQFDGRVRCRRERGLGKLRPDRQRHARGPQATARDPAQGGWKIACTVVMECTIDAGACPLVEVDPEARILWTNALARERLAAHPGLVAAPGRLRARVRKHDAGLRDAVRGAHAELRSHRPLNVVAKQAWPVHLGEDDIGVPLYAWVLLEDGKALRLLRRCPDGRPADRDGGGGLRPVAGPDPPRASPRRRPRPRGGGRRARGEGQHPAHPDAAYLRQDRGA